LLEMRNLLQRKQAEFENYRKQVDKRFIEMKELANKNLIFKLLPVVDNFNLALKSADTNSNPEDFIKGVELIYSQLFSFLENNNVQSMVTEKKKFDPYFHESWFWFTWEHDYWRITERFFVTWSSVKTCKSKDK